MPRYRHPVKRITGVINSIGLASLAAVGPRALRGLLAPELAGALGSRPIRGA